MYFSQRLSNHTTVITGDGPSLRDTNLEVVKGLAKVSIKVLAINYSLRLVPWADAFYYHHEEQVDDMMGDVDVLGRWVRGDLAVYSSSFNAKWAGRPWLVVPFSGRTGLELDPRLGIRSGGNSGAAAINLAYHMGARRVILLGFDCCEAADGSFNWWKTPKDPTRLKYDYEDWKVKFGILAGEAKAAGMEIVNASLNTKLEAFPKMSLGEALLSGGQNKRAQP